MSGSSVVGDPSDGAVGDPTGNAISDPPHIGTMDPPSSTDSGPTVTVDPVVDPTIGTDTGPRVPCPKAANAICHQLYIADNSRHQLSYVDEFRGDAAKSSVIWTAPVGETATANSPRTIEIVDNSKSKSGKAVLVSLETGYAEFDTTDGMKLTQVANFTGISSACRLPDGSTALGQNNLIIIAGPTGARIRNIQLPQGDNLRAINRNPKDGHFWFSKTSILYEITDQGLEVWHGDMGSGTKGSAVWWREGGGAYASTGEPSTVIEMDATGTIVSTVGGKGPMFPVDVFFSHFVRLPNGNYVVANWLGQVAAPDASFPDVIEFAAPCGGAPGPCPNPRNEIVWRWGNQVAARQVTNIYVLR